MGKNTNNKDGKKRKAESQQVSDSDNSQSTSFTSSILSGVNKVLYGAPPGTSPTTSTPLPGAKLEQEDDIRDQLQRNNTKLDTIITKLKKLDEIETRLKHIESDVTEMNKRVTDVEKRTFELENSVAFISGSMDEIEKDGGIPRIKSDLNAVAAKTTELERSSASLSESVGRLDQKTDKLDQFDRLQTDVRRHEKTILSMCVSMDKLRRDRKEAEEKITDLQWRSMKNNLIFNGIQGEHKYENIEEKLRCFIHQELGIAKHIEFGNVHRYGRYSRDKPRPVVARFLYNSDRTLVLENSFKLRGKPFWVSEQFPSAMEERRRQLQPVARELRANGHRVKFVRDKLFVDGSLYDEDDYEGMFDQEDYEHESMDYGDSNPNPLPHSGDSVDLR